jgi:hypothetical protein
MEIENGNNYSEGNELKVSGGGNCLDSGEVADVLSTSGIL